MYLVITHSLMQGHHRVSGDNSGGAHLSPDFQILQSDRTAVQNIIYVILRKHIKTDNLLLKM